MATRARRPRPNPAAVDPTLPSVSTGVTVGELAVADSRLGIFWGGQQLVYNPDVLQARKGGLRIYDEMRTDPQVKVCLALKVAAILGPGWDFEPGDDTPRAKQVADDLKLEFTQLQGGTFLAALEQILRTALQYGYSLTEQVYEAPDLRLIALKSRAPHHFTFEMDAYGNILWVEQLQGRGSEPLPMQKFVHFIYQPEFGNPYGRSDLRDVYTDWFHKVAWRQSMAVWGEKLADSPIKFSHPRNESAERVNATREALEHLQAKSVVSQPEGWLIELIESTKMVREVFTGPLDWYNLQISRGMLVPDKLGFAGGEVQGGSYSLSQTQLGAFFFVLDALGQNFDDAIQRQVIQRLMALRAPGDPVPKFKRLPMSDEQRLEVGRLWKELVAGEIVISDVVDENHIRQMLGFRDVEETDAEMRQQLLEDRAEQKRITQEQQQANLDATKAPPEEKAAPFVALDAAALVRMEAQHKGLLVGLWLDPEDAARLAMEGESAEAASELHVTLCYVKSPDDPAAAVRAVLAAVAGQKALPGEIGGVGRFFASDTSDGRDVLYAAPDVPGLTLLREQIAAALSGAGAAPSMAHGYTPHITLAYIDRGTPCTVQVERMPLVLRRLSIRMGDVEIASIVLPGDGAVPFSEPAYWRPLTPHEQRCDMAEKQATFAALSDDLGATLAARCETMVRSIMARVKRIEPLTADAVRKLTVNRGAEHGFRVALDEGLMRAYGRGQTEAAGELHRARADMADKQVFARAGLVGTAARKFFRNKAFDVTGKLTTDILAKAKAVLYNALKGDKTSGQVQFELSDALGEYLPERDSAGRIVNVPARVETIARTSGAEAVNEGRYALFTDPDLQGFVQGFMYSAVLDDRVRETHAAWDGVTLPTDHPGWFGPPDNRPPNGFSCRCLLVPVTVADDEVEWTDEVPAEPAADAGFK